VMVLLFLAAVFSSCFYLNDSYSSGYSRSYCYLREFSVAQLRSIQLSVVSCRDVRVLGQESLDLLGRCAFRPSATSHSQYFIYLIGV
jgi:hypothetical protein